MRQLQALWGNAGEGSLPPADFPASIFATQGDRRLCPADADWGGMYSSCTHDGA